MRVAVERNTVGIESQHAIERCVETVERLLWQPVDQVKVDGAKACCARRLGNPARHFHWLDAMDRFLHCRNEILSAEGHAVKTEFRKKRHGVRLKFARI